MMVATGSQHNLLPETDVGHGGFPCQILYTQFDLDMRKAMVVGEFSFIKL